MVAGIGFLFAITAGEIAYWKYFKAERDEEFTHQSHERQQAIKIARMEKLTAEEQEAEQQAEIG